MLVKRTIEIDSKAIITLQHNEGMIQANGETLSEYLNLVETAMNANFNELTDSPKKRKKRKDEETEEETVNLVELTAPMVHEIVVSRTSIEQEAVPIQTTKPFLQLAQKHEETLLTNLSRLSKHVVLRGEALQHLRSPGLEEVENNINDLLPDIGETSVEAINRSGLNNYEEKLRRDVTEQESRIHNLYDWFETKVIERYNSKTPVMSEVFTEDEKTIADVVISRQELLTTLFKDEIIFLNKTLSKK